MKNDSNDVKQLVTQIVPHLSHKGDLKEDSVKLFVPPLVMGTKEKNTIVRTNSEIAIISVLQLRNNDSILKVCYKFVTTSTHSHYFVWIFTANYM